MTSSVLIKKRLQEGNIWKFGDESSHYIRPVNDCLPGDIAIPIGNTWGAKICIRPQQRDQNIQINQTNDMIDKMIPYAGLNRGSVNLYDPSKRYPIQQWNPQRYEDRRIPNESLLLQNDYLRWPIKYNATGLETIHAPPMNRKAVPFENPPPFKPYYSYGYSYMAMDDSTNTWAPRSTSTPGTRCPTPLYDRTRAHQPYPIYEKEQRYIHDPLSVTYA